jgi:hypothetical protein
VTGASFLATGLEDPGGTGAWAGEQRARLEELHQQLVGEGWRLVGRGRALVVAALPAAGGGADRRRAGRGWGDGRRLTQMATGARTVSSLCVAGFPAKQGEEGQERLRLVLDLPRAPWAPGNDTVVAEDGPHPRTELGAVAARSKSASSPPAVCPTCPKQRFTAVANG